MNKQKLLFITHESALSGAPRSLLYFIEWLSSNRKDYEIHVLSLKSENPKHNAFIQLSDVYFDFTHLSTKPDYRLKNRILHKLKGTPFQSERDIQMQQLVKNHYDLIYANTVVSLPIALALKKCCPTSKVLLHVHEMATAIQQLVPDFKRTMSEVDYFIAASDLVKEHLVCYFGCDDCFYSVLQCTDAGHGWFLLQRLGLPLDGAR